MAVAAPWARAISHNGVPYYIKWVPSFDDDDGDDDDDDDVDDDHEDDDDDDDTFTNQL